MKHMFVMLFLIAILFGCSEKKKEIQQNEIVTEEIFSYRCKPPIIGIEKIKYYHAVEYEVPVVLKSTLDSIVVKEQQCECYKYKYSGFIVDFQRINNKNKIEISSRIMIQIGNYENCFGYFKYKSHYFICRGDSTLFPLKKIRNTKVINFTPKFKCSDCYSYSTSKWVLNYSKNKIEVDTYDSCIKCVQKINTN